MNPNTIFNKITGIQHWLHDPIKDTEQCIHWALNGGNKRGQSIIWKKFML